MGARERHGRILPQSAGGKAVAARPRLASRPCGTGRINVAQTKPFRAWPIPEPGKSDARTVGLLAHGSSRQIHLPGTMSQWLCPQSDGTRMKRSPLTVAGTASAKNGMTARTAFPLPARSGVVRLFTFWPQGPALVWRGINRLQR